ncbi:MAG: ABC transporter permease [Phycisphaerae bacterium]
MIGRKLAKNVRLGVKNLMLHKLRSFLTMLGVVFGVGSVIAMLAVGEGASAEALEQIRKLGSNNIIITSIQPVEDEAGAQAGQGSFISDYGLTYDDQRRIEQTIDSVSRVVPAKMVNKEAWIGDRSMELRLVGTTPDWFELVRREILAGRILTDQDMVGDHPVCVLTEHGARKLLANRDIIGQYIRIEQSHFQIVGLVRSAGGAGQNTPDAEIDAYVPIDLARQVFGDTKIEFGTGSRTAEYVELHKLIVEVKDTEMVRPTARALQTMLGRFHDREDYRFEVPQDLLEAAEQTKRTMNLVLGSIAGISLLVGGIGIMNIMLASVTERTREIGIRRAIGAKRRQIIGQFLIETVVLSFLGGLVGVGCGVALPKLITLWAGMPTMVPGYSIVLSVGISVGIGVVFGIYPAIRAAWLDPITALRHE